MNKEIPIFYAQPELFPNQFSGPRLPEPEIPGDVCQQAYDSFNVIQFDLSNCTPRCSVSDLKPELLEVASRVYEKCPFKVNCAYRSVEWDKARGRNGKSSHCKGLAMDIACSEHSQRLNLVSALIASGVRRIGIAKNFIHFDIDPDKAPSMWLYHPDNVNKHF